MGEERDKTELMVLCDRFGQLMGVYNELNERLENVLFSLRGATPTPVCKETDLGSKLENAVSSILDRLNALTTTLEIRNEKLRYSVNEFEKII